MERNREALDLLFIHSEHSLTALIEPLYSDTLTVKKNKKDKIKHPGTVITDPYKGQFFFGTVFYWDKAHLPGEPHPPPSGSKMFDVIKR